MRLLKVERSGKIPIVKHSSACDVQVKRLDVVHLSDMRFNLFSLHAVMLKSPVTLDAVGGHMRSKHLSFMRRDAGLRVEATRSFETPFYCRWFGPLQSEKDRY